MAERRTEFLSAEETIAKLQERIHAQASRLGFQGSKLVRIEQRVNRAFTLLNEVPMNPDRQNKELKDALHDVLKIVKEGMSDGVEGS